MNGIDSYVMIENVPSIMAFNFSISTWIPVEDCQIRPPFKTSPNFSVQAVIDLICM